MKLKHLLLGTMFTLAVTACTSDDPVKEIEKPVEEAKTTLRVLAQDIQTKSETDPSAAISSLQVLVFNKTQNGFVLEVIGKQNADNQYQSEEISVEGGNKAVLVVANYPEFDLPADAATGTPIDDVLAAMKDFEKDEEKDGYLTMNSKLYDKDIVIGLGLKHYLGFPKPEDETGKVYFEPNNPVKLYRNVARVKLNKVTVDGAKIVNSQQYTDLELQLDKVYILHGKESTRLMGEEGKEWASTYVEDAGYINGYPYVDGEENEPVYMFGGEKARFASLPVKDVDFRYYNGYNYDFTTPLNFDLSKKNTTVFDGVDNNPDPIEFYVYENQYNSTEDKDEIKTLLVLKTNYSYKGTEELIDAIGENGGEIVEEPEGSPSEWSCEKITNIDKRSWMELPCLWGGKLKDYYCETCRTYFNPYYFVWAKNWLGLPYMKYIHTGDFMKNHTCEDPGETENRVHFVRYYSVPVGNLYFKQPDFPTRGEGDNQQQYLGVLRNLQYNINLTISGEGYIDDKGDKGEQFLQVKVDVAPWGEVTQDAEIE